MAGDLERSHMMNGVIERVRDRGDRLGANVKDMQERALSTARESLGALEQRGRDQALGIEARVRGSLAGIEHLWGGFETRGRDLLQVVDGKLPGGGAIERIDFAALEVRVRSAVEMLQHAARGEWVHVGGWLRDAWAMLLSRLRERVREALDLTSHDAIAPLATREDLTRFVSRAEAEGFATRADVTGL